MGKEKMRICLLIVEDQRSTTKRLQITARRSKYDLDFKFYEKATDLINEFNKNKKLYDFLMLDQNLETSDMQGVDVAYHINKILGNGVVTFMLSTSSGRIPNEGKKDSIEDLQDMTELEAAEEAGAKGWLTKGGKMISKIDYVIDHYKDNTVAENMEKDFLVLGDDF